jgi:outer membrane protein OmpA-like peptidoglycan-associated protein
LNEYPKTTVTVMGYTDSVGSTESNRDLSRRRARAVADYLGQRGVSPARMVVDSRGEEDPIASNDTEAGRAQNRRVELVVRPMNNA